MGYLHAEMARMETKGEANYSGNSGGASPIDGEGKKRIKAWQSTREAHNWRGELRAYGKQGAKQKGKMGDIRTRREIEVVSVPTEKYLILKLRDQLRFTAYALVCQCSPSPGGPPSGHRRIP